MPRFEQRELSLDKIHLKDTPPGAPESIKASLGEKLKKIPPLIRELTPLEQSTIPSPTHLLLYFPEAYGEAQKQGLSSLACVIDTQATPEKDSLSLSQYIEDLNPQEEGELYHFFLQEGLRQIEIALLFGKERYEVSRRLKPFLETQEATATDMQQDATLSATSLQQSATSVQQQQNTLQQTATDPATNTDDVKSHLKINIPYTQRGYATPETEESQDKQENYTPSSPLPSPPGRRGSV